MGSLSNPGAETFLGTSKLLQPIVAVTPAGQRAITRFAGRSIPGSQFSTGPQIAPSGAIIMPNSDGRIAGFRAFHPGTGLVDTFAPLWCSNSLGYDLDAAGALYLLNEDSLLYKFAPDGSSVSVYGGVPWPVWPGNDSILTAGDGGPVTAATFFQHRYMAIDRGRQRLYLTHDGGSIRMVDLVTGLVSTVAGPQAPSPTSGPICNFAISVDVSGTIWTVNNGQVFATDPTTFVTTVIAGVPGYFPSGSGDGGPATAAEIAVAISATALGGQLYIFCNTLPGVMRRVDLGTGLIDTPYTNPDISFSFPTAPPLDSTHLVVGAAALSVLDLGSMSLTPVAGTAGFPNGTNAGTDVYPQGEGATALFTHSDGLPATGDFANAFGVCQTPDLDHYLWDTNNGTALRRVDHTDGTLHDVPETTSATTYGGGLAVHPLTGDVWYSLAGDVFRYTPGGGAATLVSTGVMGDVWGLCFDSTGVLYALGDDLSFRESVMRLDTTTGAGTHWAIAPTNGYSGDGGLATLAEFEFPNAITCDHLDRLLIADSDNSAIRRVDAAGIVTTIMGTPPTWGTTGDGGPASAACLNDPYGIAYDLARHILYIAEIGDLGVGGSRAFSPRIRAVDMDADVVSTLVNTRLGQSLYVGADGVYASDVPLDFVNFLSIDRAGALYLGLATMPCVLTVAPTPTLRVCPRITAPWPSQSINTATMPTLTWTAVAGAASYDLEFSLQPDFGTLLTTLTVGTTSHVVGAGDLPTFLRVWWRVRATGGSDWSDTLAFRLIDAPPSITLVSPIGGAPVSGSPTFVFDTTLPYQSYLIQFTTDPTFSYTGAWNNQTTLSHSPFDSSFSISFPTGVIYYRVTPIFDDEYSGAYVQDSFTQM